MILAALCVTVLGACASPPTQEIADARQSIAAAQGASGEARVWLGAAERSLAQAVAWSEQGAYELSRHEALAARDHAARAAAGCCASHQEYRGFKTKKHRWFGLY